MTKTQTMKQALRIGTRGSALARWQASHIGSLIQKALPSIKIEIAIIKTTGDKILDAPFAQIGGKGVFVKEIEDALLDGTIDIAVHSMKDMPTELPTGLEIGAVTERASPLDAFCSSSGTPFSELPQGAKVGTSSVRRAAQLLHLRPDLTIVPLRGNVDTRIKKLHTEGLDGVILAQAGLERMGLGASITECLSIDIMVPAPGQGIIAIESREDDREVAAILETINHTATLIASRAERGFLAELEGGCSVPAGCYAQSDGDELSILGLVASPDGKALIRKSINGKTSQNETLGRTLAKELLEAGGREILSEIPSEIPSELAE